MTPFRFAESWLWILAFGIATVIVAYLRARRLAKAARAQFADQSVQQFTIYPIPQPTTAPGSQPIDSQDRSRIAWQRSFCLALSILILLTLAALRPQAGFTTIPLPKLTTSIVICLDSSLSMGAEDFKPSRFEHARRKLLDLLSRLRGERVALVTFSGVPFVESPLTDDYASLRTFITGLKPHSNFSPGSDISAAISTAASLIPKQATKTNGSAVILIVSDGEMTVGELSPALERARGVNAQVFGLMVATPTGAPVPFGPGVRGGFKTDRKGDIVISKLETGPLEQLAKETGGKLITSTTGDQDLRALYDNVIGQFASERADGERSLQVWNEFYQIPLLIALLLLVLERRIARQRLRQVALVTLLICNTLPGVAHSESTADSVGQKADQYFEQGKFAEALTQYRLGKQQSPADKRFAEGEAASLLRLGSTQEAEDLYRALARNEPNPQLKSRDLFQAGVAAYRGVRLESAKSLFDEALKVTPEDKETQENLRYVEKLLRKPPQSSSSSSLTSSSASSSLSSSSGSSGSPSSSGSSSEGVSSSAESESASSTSVSSGDSSSDSEGSASTQSSGTASSAANSGDNASEESANSSNDQSNGGSSAPSTEDQPSQGTQMQDAPADQLQYMLDNLEEDPSIREQFRREQAEQLLRQKGRNARPEKDW